MKMAISWTLIVLGVLLQGMQCNTEDPSPSMKIQITSASATTPDLATDRILSTTNTPSSALVTPATASPQATPASVTTTPTNTLTTLETTKPTSQLSLTDPSKTTAPPTTATATASQVQTEPNAIASEITTQNVSLTTNEPKTQTAIPSTTFKPNTPNQSNTATAVIPKQSTTNVNTPITSTSTEAGTTQLPSKQTDPPPSKTTISPITAETDSKSTASQNHGTTTAQTTASNRPDQEKYSIHFDSSNITEEGVKSAVQNCMELGKTKGTCKVTVEIDQLNPTITTDVENNKTQQKDDVNKDTDKDTLIAILASCGALVLILCCFAAYCTYHRRSYRKNQQHLTEELQTVENGYHDNPTLEVMEVQPEMQEKKLTMNGEFNDSWIVPIDNLLKEDIPDEEDTHL